MRRIDFNVPIYDWNIVICTTYDISCKEALSSLADEFCLPDKEELLSLLNQGHNGGRTYSKTSSRTIVIILFSWTDEEWFVKTINHEKRHIVDDIVEWHNLEGKEAPAYLDGYISAEIYKRLNQLK